MMSGNKTGVTPAPSRTCDCCKESVRLTDEDGLCFSCDLVRTFATIIEEQTDIAGDALLISRVNWWTAHAVGFLNPATMMKRRTSSRTSALG